MGASSDPTGLDDVGFCRAGRPDDADQRQRIQLDCHSGVQFCALDHVSARLADLGADDVQRAVDVAQQRVLMTDGIEQDDPPSDFEF
jgi:hypothetical protein